MNFLEKYREDFKEYDAMERDFIDDELIWQQLNKWENPSKDDVRRVLEKSARLVRLEPEEMAILIQTKDPEMLTEIYALAHKLKREIYGERIVFFAPLYVSDKCANDCVYCGYRCSNLKMHRKTLSMEEITREVEIMIGEGQKRLVMDAGEAPETGIDFICDCLKQIYSVKSKHGEIRRANLNCAPMSREEIRRLKEVGIGTFQVFQETYHHDTYRKVHPTGIKSHYRWRLYSQDRSLDAGADDVGIGALFGLYDWRFEAMGLLYHTMHLEEKYNGVGPHTISFPRIKFATGTPYALNPEYAVSDAEFKRLVAIIRLSVPYTGMILSARESAPLRREVIPLGISQIDAGSRIGVGGYQESAAANAMPDKEQFRLSDTRSLDEAIRETCETGDIPSLCTACYRKGRTGEHFMGIAKSGFVHNFCMPNAICTLKEYLLDYASPETKKAGEAAIQKYLPRISDVKTRQFVDQALRNLENGERDQYI
ncbi:MAG TPA: [FeFe] hydrogenase H-cluster radical SAM maturase HydG [Firmicutes bacterium]|jgi:2-iminoacetate synthase|nr:[FeFe] hydrogenase H-cluster radical SAM maturase HydG [Bacillota bacterium]